MNMQNLCAQTIPLTGKHLIEASAGTGKTYNITRIYLRLLLEQELSVEQILLMTFTKDATQELRGRIDVFIAREESIRPLIDKYNYQKLRIAQYQYETPVTGYIAISKNSYLQQDIQKISSVIKQIKDSGELDKVYYKNL